MPKRSRKVHHYRSKTRYIYYRNLKEYNRYKKLYEKKIKKLHDMGITPYNESKGLGMLSMKNYLSNKDFYKENGIKDNIMRKILNSQMYQFSHETAMALKKAISEDESLNKDMGNLSIYNIRASFEFNLDKIRPTLKEYWKALKERNEALPEKDQKTYKELEDEMEMDWFGYTQ